MEVIYKWPDCEFLNFQWGEKKIDSFVVKATHDEAACQIIPKMGMAPSVEDRKKQADGSGCEHFLVSKDLSSVVLIAWYYPFGNLWNGCSPFRAIKPPLRISSLSDLANLMTPNEVTIEIPENLNQLIETLQGLEQQTFPLQVSMKGNALRFENIKELRQFKIGMTVMWDILDDRKGS